MEDAKYDYGSSDRVTRDFHYEPQPKRTFSLSPLGVTEIQYIRGLIRADQLINKYEEEGNKALIDRKTTMFEFTEKILRTLDKLENNE